MSHRPRAHKDPHPYSYAIPRVKCPPPEIVLQLNPWNVQEFFRIELLLRSRIVVAIYDAIGDTPEGSAKLIEGYGFGWYALRGRHRRLLDPKTKRSLPVQIWTYPQLADNSGWGPNHPNWFISHMKTLLEPTEADTAQQQYLDACRQKFVCVIEASPNVPLDDIIEKLRPVLARRQRGVSKKPYGFDPQTWLDYLSCYDLHEEKGLSVLKVGELVYKKSGKPARSLAKTAWQRVRDFIELAESNDWPPRPQRALPV